MNPDIFNLSLEQQFELKTLEMASHELTHEQLRILTLQAAELLMRKDNALRDLTKKLVEAGI